MGSMDKPISSKTSDVPLMKRVRVEEMESPRLRAGERMTDSEPEMESDARSLPEGFVVVTKSSKLLGFGVRRLCRSPLSATRLGSSSGPLPESSLSVNGNATELNIGDSSVGSF